MNLFIRTAGRVFFRKERLSDHDTIQREQKTPLTASPSSMAELFKLTRAALTPARTQIIGAQMFLHVSADNNSNDNNDVEKEVNRDATSRVKRWINKSRADDSRILRSGDVCCYVKGI